MMLTTMPVIAFKGEAASAEAVNKDLRTRAKRANMGLFLVGCLAEYGRIREKIQREKGSSNEKRLNYYITPSIKLLRVFPFHQSCTAIQGWDPFHRVSLAPYASSYRYEPL